MRTERAESRVCNKYALRQHSVDSAIYCTVCIIICRCTLHDHRYILHIPVFGRTTLVKLFDVFKTVLCFPRGNIKDRVGFANEGLAVWVVRRMGTSVKNMNPTDTINCITTAHFALNKLIGRSPMVASPSVILVSFNCLGQLNSRILISYTSKSRNDEWFTWVNDTVSLLGL